MSDTEIDKTKRSAALRAKAAMLQSMSFLVSHHSKVVEMLGENPHASGMDDLYTNLDTLNLGGIDIDGDFDPNAENCQGSLTEISNELDAYVTAWEAQEIPDGQTELYNEAREDLTEARQSLTEAQGFVQKCLPATEGTQAETTEGEPEGETAEPGETAGGETTEAPPAEEEAPAPAETAGDAPAETTEAPPAEEEAPAPAETNEAPPAEEEAPAPAETTGDAPAEETASP